MPRLLERNHGRLLKNNLPSSKVFKGSVMSRGDLVKLKAQIHHTSGLYLPGLVGIIVGIKQPSIRDSRLIAVVRFGDNDVTCYGQELEVLSSSGGFE
jgi:hypothetical protein